MKHKNNINSWYAQYIKDGDENLVFKIADAYLAWMVKYTRNGTQKISNDEALSRCYYAVARALNKYDENREASFSTILHYEMLGGRKDILTQRLKDDMYKDIIDSADEYPSNVYMTYDINDIEHSTKTYDEQVTWDYENGIVNTNTLLKIADDIGLHPEDMAILEKFVYNGRSSEDLEEILYYIKQKLEI